MLFYIKTDIKNNICNNALGVVTMGYNEGRFLAPLKTNRHNHIICKKDDSKQTAKRKPGHRPAEPEP